MTGSDSVQDIANIKLIIRTTKRSLASVWSLAITLLLSQMSSCAVVIFTRLDEEDESIDKIASQVSNWVFAIVWIRLGLDVYKLISVWLLALVRLCHKYQIEHLCVWNELGLDAAFRLISAWLLAPAASRSQTSSWLFATTGPQKRSFRHRLISLWSLTLCKNPFPTNVKLIIRVVDPHFERLTRPK